MSLTKTPLVMLEARGTPDSDVRFDGQQLRLTNDDDPNNFGVVSGNFDDATGTLTLTLVNGLELKINGFLTTGGIGLGKEGIQGLKGADGKDGVNGKDGERGETGCIGPVGPKGEEGATGPTGPRGLQGQVGPTGPMGLAGTDGIIEVYIQNEDPGSSAAAGAIWVKTTDN